MASLSPTSRPRLDPASALREGEGLALRSGPGETHHPLPFGHITPRRYRGRRAWG